MSLSGRERVRAFNASPEEMLWRSIFGVETKPFIQMPWCIGGCSAGPLQTNRAPLVS
jgi:hypothetical protein